MCYLAVLAPTNITYVVILMNLPTLMGSLGGWVFVVDVTRGSVEKTV